MTHPPIEEDETNEMLGPYFFIQKKRGFKLTNDPILLADFILPLSCDDRVIDLGTGAGVIPLILAWRSGARGITGVEVDEGAVKLARRNIGNNGLSGRVEIVHKDFRDLRSIYPEGSFSLVVSNPPYVKAGAGRVSPLRERALARSEAAGGLKDLVSTSAYLSGEKGRICCIFPVARLFEMLSELKGAGLEARRLRFIRTSPQRRAKLFMIEAGKTGELEIEEPVFI